MNKKDDRFDLWCHAATVLIRYGPDRKAVAKELRGHMEDAYDAAIRRGLTEEEAISQTMDAMGKAHELAPMLAAIHKPFWGYLIRVSQIMLAVLLVLCLLPIYNYITGLHLSDAPQIEKFDVYDRASYGADTGRTLLHLSSPQVSFSSPAGTFTVTDAAVFTTHSADGEKSYTQLYLQVQQRSALPWKEHQEYSQLNHYVIGSFTARDSLGNEYDCQSGNYLSKKPRLFSDTAQSGIFTGTHTLWITNFPQDAKWVELLYSRDGQHYVLRIDLTGGVRT